MKKLLIASLAFSFLTFPITGADAAPVPCDRGHIPVGSGDDYHCVTRREFNALRAPSARRGYERFQANITRRSQKAGTIKERSFATRFASSRTRDRRFNPFSLREPQSRRYNPGQKIVSTNLRQMRASQTRRGVAASRAYHAPAATWTRRTKQEFFNTNVDATKSLRMRRGY